MKKYELTSLQGLTFQCWLVNRYEQERFAACVRKWKQENPKATIVQEMLAESLIRCHIWEQRLVDRRFFFDGEKTDYAQVRDREIDITTDDLKRKNSEFKEMMPQIQKWKSELLKLALANSINVDVHGDISQLLLALDKQKGSSGENGRFHGEETRQELYG